LTGQHKGVSIGSDFSAKGDVTVTFKPPVSVLSQIPNATSGNCTITCYTYTSDGASVGTKTVNLTFNVPDYTPTASVELIPDNALIDSESLAIAYVAGKTTMTVKTTASTSYGASIKSYSSTVDGVKYTGAKFTTAPLKAAENKVISVTVTDTRGKVVTVSKNAFTVYAYSTPKITNFVLERGADGTTVVATVKGSITSANNVNKKSLTISFNGVTETVDTIGYSVNHTKTYTNVDTDKTFTATATLKDAFSSTTKTFVLPTVAVTMDFHHSGKGVAFGKVAEDYKDDSGNDKGLLDVNWDVLMRRNAQVSGSEFAPFSIRRESELGAAIGFRNSWGLLGAIGMAYAPNGGLLRWTSDTKTSYLVLDTGNTKDYIIEQGTSGDWVYEKWNSGVAKCYTSVSVKDKPITTAWGALYQSDLINLPTFPSEVSFTVAPRVFLQFSNVGGHTALISGASNVSKTSSGEAYLFRPAAATLSNGSIVIEAIGKWK
jgi:hypothetical protein